MSQATFSQNFWGLEDEGCTVLWDRIQNDSKTCEELMQFYKERIAIEEEYSRKLGHLSRKTLGSKETNAMGHALETLRVETKQLSLSHAAQAGKIRSDVYTSLQDFASDLKGKAKPIESNTQKLKKYKDNLEAKTEQMRQKYQADYIKYQGYETNKIMLDDREAERLEVKINKTYESMMTHRKDYYSLVRESQQLNETWLTEWQSALNNFQELEEEKAKFLKANTWEYANAVSTSCLADDKACENIRLSLEQCNYKDEILSFVHENGTGDKVLSPPDFVDYFNGEEAKPRQAAKVKNVTREPSLKAKEPDELPMTRKTTRRPQLMESLQPEYKPPASISVPSPKTEVIKGPTALTESSFSENSMATHRHTSSQYSNPTSVSGFRSSTGSEAKSAKNWNSPTRRKSKQSDALLESTTSRISFEAPKNSSIPPSPSTDAKIRANPLKAYLNDLELGGNGDMSKFRESMMSAKDLRHTSEDYHAGTLSDEKLFGKSSSRRDENTILGRESSLRKSKSWTTPRQAETIVAPVPGLPRVSTSGNKVIKYSRAQYSYSAEIEQEISFKKRDVLLVLLMQPDGWWYVENTKNGETGLAPSNYLVDI
ncbi:unnamed protein product [Kuraishia capsulata CBS 1993]|uniref:SH3 domain-containing protein n=1 Tax=Kuraishia capsulata CBS 1993 TaxID=1382522 RepID=W6MUL9_9ASCO|nr:uncharacterized protein KUCA_T00001715001 [Kuraishia capsulata CBS 1993]CDK25745.1 unnamed protein product [Kuraishia capsulata CBS 1993]